MNKVLRVLIIEDVLTDVVLINSELRKGGLAFRSKRVDCKEGFLSEIKNDPPDVILADHGLPSFDSFTALTIANKECPNVPFIFVTGAMGEETAIETMKSGAADYVLKNHLSNLVPAIKRALRQAEERAKNRAVEAALRESEQRFRTLVDGVEDYAIFMLDVQGRITSWNAGAEWIENYRAEEILGRSFGCLYRDEDAAAHKPEEALKVASAAGRFEEEAWRLRKSGAPFWSKMVITALRDEGRNLRGFAVVMQDLTPQRQTLETWKQYEAIVNTTRDFLTLIDSDFRYITANDAYCRAHGKKREEIIGATVADLWGQEVFQNILREPLTQCLSGQEVRYQAWFSFPALGRRFFEVSYYPYSPEGGVTHVIVDTHDITDLHRAQAVMEDLNGDLERRVAERTAESEASLHEIEALCYSISHDLRAPLRHIDGFVQLLQQEVADHLNAESRNYLTTISESAKQMGRLIDGLLAFSRIGRQEMNLSSVDLAELINEVLQELQVQWAGREIKWDIGEMPAVRADRILLRLALAEILSNAEKATRSQPEARVEIGGTTAAREIVVFIRDNGVGFEAEYAEKLFGVFQKLHSLEEFEGPGIGLAKVRRILQRHGGRTWAEATVGKGATFYLALPLPKTVSSDAALPADPVGENPKHDHDGHTK